MKSIAILFAVVAAVCYSLSLSEGAQQSHFQGPVLLTSAGQSADVTMAELLCKKAGLKATVLSMAKPEDLKGIRTLIIVPGFSSKGLGAAGVSREEEMERVAKLIEAARKVKTRILVMHIGGKARRGGQSDDFNRRAAESAEQIIVVKQGDEDRLFSTIASERKIPLILVDKMSAAVKPLQEAFRSEKVEE